MFLDNGVLLGLELVVGLGLELEGGIRGGMGRIHIRSRSLLCYSFSFALQVRNSGRVDGR
jgi:hypothetical protein